MRNLVSRFADSLFVHRKKFDLIGSSLSDQRGYKDLCYAAANDPKVFATFRRSAAYNAILEHVDAEQGKQYLSIINDRYPHLLDHLDRFKSNDRDGAPLLVEYPETGAISPTTLRYIKVLGDLERLFGSLSTLHIVEIGAGYGGQCKIINDYERFEAYTIIDLPEALALSRRFLAAHDIGAPKVRFVAAEDCGTAIAADLVISNYAFTECNRAAQTAYLHNILLRSPRGYMSCNVAGHGRPMSRRELRRAIPGAEELPEEPLTHKRNYLLVWGTQLAAAIRQKRRA
ncbi:MAG: putative sugar O-methyltransferase [Inquilinus sp.]|nr:putative sugar O-methyltransferase [Inquilinus sp.]